MGATWSSEYPGARSGGALPPQAGGDDEGTKPAQGNPWRNGAHSPPVFRSLARAPTEPNRKPGTPLGQSTQAASWGKGRAQKGEEKIWRGKEKRTGTNGFTESAKKI